jgi:hypothetical protein
VLHQDDDAEEDQEGAVRVDSGNLELIQESGTQLVGLRFDQIQLAHDSVIRSAYVQFTCDKPSKAPTSLIIAGENSSDASRFTKDRHDLSSRSMTTEDVHWVPKEWKKAGDAKEPQRTPDLSSIIREIIKRPDWEPGNAIALLIRGDGKRAASAFRTGDQKVAALVVDADPGSASIREPTTPEPYRLRLLFGLPPEAETRVFDVVVQGETVRQDLRLTHDDEGLSSESVTIDGVMIGDELHVQLVPKTGHPLLSGLELVRQQAEPTQ